EMDHAEMDHGDAPEEAMDHEAMGHDTPMAAMHAEHMSRMRDMHARLMADPVIRNRIAADAELERMMEEMHAAMAHGHGMERKTSPRDRESAEVIEFVLRLLSDPRIEARIHEDPRLHELWSDPEVQRLLEAYRREGAGPEGHEGHGAGPDR
ncbi:MAG: hypothetical protein KY466_11165, partial [Gemmatimonadetes bacterium]|nr:hypothetical protein [Gemmatimonadota bacterium]